MYYLHCSNNDSLQLELNLALKELRLCETLK